MVRLGSAVTAAGPGRFNPHYLFTNRTSRSGVATLLFCRSLRSGGSPGWGVPFRLTVGEFTTLTLFRHPGGDPSDDAVA